MSTLEDIGFLSFIARDTVGAVAVSSSEMWIGGALALGAVVGAVYAYPRKINDEIAEHERNRPTQSDFFTGPRDVAEAVYHGRPLEAGSAGERADIRYREKGLIPGDVYRDELDEYTSASEGGQYTVVYRPTRHVTMFLPEAIGRKLLAGERVDPSEAGGNDHLTFMLDRIQHMIDSGEYGVGMGGPTINKGEMAISFFPGQRCMIHPECREHPEIGAACKLESWKGKWHGKDSGRSK